MASKTNESVAVDMASSGSGQKQDKRKNRQKARSQFNASAPTVSVDKFFGDFTQTKRHNVDVEVDLTVSERIEDSYAERALEYAEFLGNLPARRVDMVIDARLVVQATLLRKMVLSTPASKQTEVAKYASLMKTELQSFPSVISAFANIGKFEFDDFVVRLKNNVINIHRFSLVLCITALDHRAFQGRYGDRVINQLRAVDDISKVVFGDRASVEWLHEEANKYFEDVRKTDFPVTDANGNTFRVTYPYLRIEHEYEHMKRNLLEWFGKLHAAMPGIDGAVNAGFAALFPQAWFDIGNYQKSIPELDDDFPAWITTTPKKIIEGLGLTMIRYRDIIPAMTGYLDILADVFSHLGSVPAGLGGVFKFAKMPDDAFGSRAQLVVVDDSQMVDVPHRFLPRDPYLELRNNAFGHSMFKVKEKGLVSTAMMFGLSRSAKLSEMYEARLNGSIASIRKAYLSSDFKQIV